MESKRRQFWVKAGVITGAWALYALNSTIHSHYQTMLAGRPIPLGRIIFGEFSFGAMWALVTPLILYLRTRWPIARPRMLLNVARHFLVAACCIAFTKLSWDVLYQPQSGWVRTGFTWKKVVLSVGGFYESGILLYTLVLMAAYAVEYYLHLRQEQLTSARLRAQIAEAQLRALRMQIHPHFLFNTLHTISALVQEDPQAAERTIARLSDLLRITLDTRDEAEVPLSQEMKFLDLYLEIEQTRYEDRLAVSRTIAPEAGDALVPHFVLQPLVENAIRHGLEPQVDGGHITVRALRDGASIVLEVADTGAGFDPLAPVASGGSRFGLAQVRERVATAYDGQGRVELNATPGQGTLIRIHLPAARTGG